MLENPTAKGLFLIATSQDDFYSLFLVRSKEHKHSIVHLIVSSLAAILLKTFRSFYQHKKSSAIKMTLLLAQNGLIRDTRRQPYIYINVESENLFTRQGL